MGHEPLQIELFGPLRLRAEGGGLQGWSTKERALLVHLVWAGRPVERGVLCGLLWPEVPEDRARLSLRVALTRLRSTLGDRMHADRRTVTFTARADDDVDLHAVRAVLAGVAARGALSADDGVHHALARVRGPLGEGLDDGTPAPFQQWLATARTDVDAELGALAAGATGAATGMVLGKASDTASEVASDEAAGGESNAGDDVPLSQQRDVLRGALERDPLQEGVVRDLMLALARAGMYDEAEAVYRQFESTLSERTTLAPAAATTQLRHRIETARVRGARHNLPEARPGSARSADLARLVRWLVVPGRRLITLVGPAGSGKSGLAIAAAREVVDRYLDGVLWVATERTGHTSLADRIAVARHEMDGPEPPGSADTTEVAATTAVSAPIWTGHERLVILDGLDPTPNDAHAVVEILEAAPRLRLLITATAPLGLVFEHRFPVGQT